MNEYDATLIPVRWFQLPKTSLAESATSFVLGGFGNGIGSISGTSFKLNSRCHRFTSLADIFNVESYSSKNCCGKKSKKLVWALEWNNSTKMEHILGDEV